MAKRALKWLWYSIAVLIISVAVLVSAGRLLFPQAYRLKPTFEQYLAERTGATVKIGAVHGAWRGYGPELRVEGIELLTPGTGEPLLTISRFEAALDIPRSLLNWHAVMRRFEVDGLKALVELDKNGALVLPGLDIERGEDSEISAQYVIDALLRQNRVAITQTEIRYRRRQGDIIPLVLPEISLRNQPNQHQAIGELRVHDGGAAKFVLEFTDYPLRRSDRMTFYLNSESLDLARLPLPTAPLGVHLEDGDLQLQIWANWHDGGWRDGQAQVNLSQLLLVNDDQQRKQIPRFGGRLHFARADDDTWYLHGDDVQWQLDDDAQPPIHIEGAIARQNDGHRWGIDLGSLALADLLELVQFSSALPAELRQQLTELALSADLPRLQFDLQVQDEAVVDWAAAARFEQLRYTSAKLPLIGTVAGRVLVSPDGGAVRLQAAEQTIDFHQLFRAPLSVTALDVGLRWQQQTDSVLLTVPSLQISNADAMVAARGALMLANDAEPELALAVNIQQGVGAHASAYLPVAVMSDTLIAYLDRSIQQADVRNADAVIRGNPKAFPFTHFTGVFDLAAEVGNASFQFDDKWPAVTELDAALRFSGNSMFIDIKKGQLGGWQVDEGSVVLDPMSGPNTELLVQAKGGGSGAAAFSLLRNSPLRDVLAPLTNTLEVTGALRTELALAIPLHSDGHARVQGNVQFGNANLLLKPLQLPLTAARGEVAFAEYGITGGTVRMQALGGQLQANLSGDRGGGRIAFNGQADSESIARWTPHPMQQKLLGRFDYDGQVLLPGTEQQGVKVELQSDLRGLAVDAPAPFGKSADAIAALSFVAGVESERLSLFADYQQQLVFQAERREGQALHAEFLLGGTSYAGHTPGFSIRGNMDKVAAETWIPFVADLVAASQREATGTPADNTTSADAGTVASTGTDAVSAAPALAISLAEVDFYGLPLSDVQLGGRAGAAGYELSLRAPMVTGELRFDDGKPIQVTLEKFLHEAPQEPVVADATTVPAVVPSPAPPPQRNPADWPQLLIDCKQCRFYSRDLGHVQVSLLDQGADKTVRVQAERNGLLNAKLEGLWSSTEQQTQMKGRIASNDWGKLTLDWGVDLSVRQSSGHIDLDLRWPQSPVDFRLRDSRGEIHLRLGKGHIARSSDNAERVLRVFSLLSLQSITRRLSLDFSDLFRDGFYYDSIRGSFAIADGKAVTQDTLIDGVSAGIALTGETDFVARTLNQQIEVTPKLTSSLPILAGWAINPPAGVLVWLMNKLFIDSAFKVVTSLQYTARGPWDNPEVIERGRTEKEVPVPEEGLPEPGQAPAVGEQPQVVPPPTEPKPETGS